MRPVEFPGQTVVIAKDQPQYIPLPARRYGDRAGTVTTCWAFTWRERLRILLTGKMWLDILTFNEPLQPLRPYVLPGDGLVEEKVA